MKFLLAVALIAAAYARTHAAPYDTGAGYTPDSGVFDNAATSLDAIPTIPEAPHCTVKPETVLEVHKMRSSALQIKNQIDYEVHNMEKRKAYVEQMTSYLNDRIRELNKVKLSIKSEEKFIALAQARMSKLQHEEDLIKVKDIIACLKGESAAGAANGKNNAATLKAMEAKEVVIKGRVKAVAEEMAKIVKPASF